MRNSLKRKNWIIEIFLIINIYLLFSGSSICFAYFESLRTGTRAIAMGGCAIMNVDVESGVFTNPGLLPLVDNKKSVISLKMNDRNLFSFYSIAVTSDIFTGQNSIAKKFSIEDYLKHSLDSFAEPPKPKRPNLNVGVGILDANDRINLHESTGYYISAGKILSYKNDVFDFNKKKPYLYGGLKLNIDKDTVALNNISVNRSSLGLGLVYKRDKRTRIGLTADNLLENYKGSVVRRPLTLGFGFEMKTENETVFSAEVTNITNENVVRPREYHFGMEKRLMKEMFVVRFGSWNGDFTMGFGFDFDKQFYFDYTKYINGTGGRDLDYISATFNF